MKTKRIRLMLGILLALCFTSFAVAAAQTAGASKWSLGLRRHMTHEDFDDLPFEDDDFSYALSYEYHESAAYWQFAVDYCPDLDAADTVITPSINLIIKDSVWRAGIGLLKSYVIDEEATGEDNWTDIYWQLMAGINIPLFGQDVDIMANYSYEDWGDVGEFDMDEMEYGIWVRFNL